ncbi:excalibur calcium-binding domain-containing protein [Streptomyces sp. TR06-5]|uniref:excalibur calcium-binding domain-containing protein n=1 Tax=Streptomyces sp. TR06-5 TaxID=3385976 RepID=UPI0039A10ABA
MTNPYARPEGSSGSYPPSHGPQTPRSTWKRNLALALGVPFACLVSLSACGTLIGAVSDPESRQATAPQSSSVTTTPSAHGSASPSVSASSPSPEPSDEKKQPTSHAPETPAPSKSAKKRESGTSGGSRDGEGTSVYYSSCSQARAAGALPLHRGEVGYGSHLDGDGDGVACEPSYDGSSGTASGAGGSSSGGTSSASGGSSSGGTSSTSGGTSVYYENCDAARAAGAAPVRRGDPGYGSHLDRDGDGVACES